VDSISTYSNTQRVAVMGPVLATIKVLTITSSLYYKKISELKGSSVTNITLT